MNSSELRRKLRRMGVTFENHKGGSGHITAKFNGRKVVIPTHGSGKELGTGLVKSVLKRLGIKTLE